MELERPVFLKAVARAFGPRYMTMSAHLLLYSACKIGMILFLKELLLFLRDVTGSDPHWKGFMWALLMVFCQFVQVTMHHQYFFAGSRYGMQTRVATTSLIYAKSLSLHATAFAQTSTGQAVNLVSNDPYKFDDAGPFLHYLWNAPLEAAVIFYLIYLQVGVAFFAGFGVLMFFFVLQSSFSCFFGRIRSRTVVHSDARVKAVGEILMGTEIIKMYNWEEPLEARVDKERRAEIDSIATNTLLKAINLACYFGVFIVVSVVTFTVYEGLGNTLTADRVFTTVSFFGQVAFPLLTAVPVAAEKAFEVMIATRRMGNYLLLEEDLLNGGLTFDHASVYKPAKGSSNNSDNNNNSDNAGNNSSAADVAAAGADSGIVSTVEALPRGSVRIPGLSFAWPEEVDPAAAKKFSRRDRRRPSLTLTRSNSLSVSSSSSALVTGNNNSSSGNGGVAGFQRGHMVRLPSLQGRALTGGRSVGLTTGRGGGAGDGASTAAALAQAEAHPHGVRGAPELTRVLSAFPVDDARAVSNVGTGAGAVAAASVVGGLREVDITITPGALAVIAGTVGAYKSSLLHALLGEMPVVGADARSFNINGSNSSSSGATATAQHQSRARGLSESPFISGKIAYASQKPWIFAASVRDNILFGSRFDAERYDRVIHACALTRDLTLLPQGDDTVIGERGATLSGGQRARVALARACYAVDSDVVVLDDVLAAVDPAVAQHIFANCLGPNGFLNGKTRVVVSHQANVLPAADVIVVMHKGRVAFQGRFPELKAAALAARDAQQGRLTRKLSSHAVSANTTGHGAGHLGAADGGALRGAGEGAVDVDAVQLDGNPFHTVTYLKSHGNLPTKNDAASAKSAEKKKTDAAVGGIAGVAAVAVEDVTEDEDDEDDDDGRAGSVNCLIPYADVSNEGIKDDEGEVEVVEVPTVTSITTTVTDPSAAGAAAEGDKDKDKKAMSGFALEKSSEGSISSTVFTDYFFGLSGDNASNANAAGRGRVSVKKQGSSRCVNVFSGICVVLAMLIAPAAKVAGDFFLSDWTAQPAAAQPGSSYRTLFIVLSVVAVAFGFVRSIWFTNAVLRSAAAAHAKMFAGILYSPMSFFHENPLGRVLNRFSKDQATLDELLPSTLFDFAQLLLSLLSTIIVVGIIAPYILILIALIIPVYFWMRAVYIVSSREIKRLEGTSRSPVLALFSSSISGGGLTVLRAYAMQRPFQQAFHSLVDANSKVLNGFFYTSRWLGYRLDLMSVVLTLGTALFCVGIRGSGGGIGMSPTAVGLALSYVTTVASQFQWMTRQSTEVENQVRKLKHDILLD